MTVIGRQVDGVRVDEADQMFESSRDLLTHIYGSKNEHINRCIQKENDITKINICTTSSFFGV